MSITRETLEMYSQDQLMGEFLAQIKNRNIDVKDDLIRILLEHDTKDRLTLGPCKGPLNNKTTADTTLPEDVRKRLNGMIDLGLEKESSLAKSRREEAMKDAARLTSPGKTLDRPLAGSRVTSPRISAARRLTSSAAERERLSESDLERRRLAAMPKAAPRPTSPKRDLLKSEDERVRLSESALERRRLAAMPKAAPRPTSPTGRLAATSSGRERLSASALEKQRLAAMPKTAPKPAPRVSMPRPVSPIVKPAEKVSMQKQKPVKTPSKQPGAPDETMKPALSQLPSVSTLERESVERRTLGTDEELRMLGLSGRSTNKEVCNACTNLKQRMSAVDNLCRKAC